MKETAKSCINSEPYYNLKHRVWMKFGGSFDSFNAYWYPYLSSIGNSIDEPKSIDDIVEHLRKLANTKGT